MRGEELKLERKKSVQATLYLSASTQFEQKQSKSKHKQRLFECFLCICVFEVLRDKLQNLNVKSIDYALKLIYHALE